MNQQHQQRNHYNADSFRDVVGTKNNNSTIITSNTHYKNEEGVVPSLPITIKQSSLYTMRNNNNVIINYGDHLTLLEQQLLHNDNNDSREIKKKAEEGHRNRTIIIKELYSSRHRGSPDCLLL